MKTLIRMLLCGAALLVPAAPLHAAALHTGEETADARTGVRMTAPGGTDTTGTALPLQYDLRTRGLVSSVKSQGSYGTCWTFSAYGSLESTLIERTPDVDFSESAFAYYAYSDLFGFPAGEAGSTADLLKKGGNYYIASPLLTSWIMPVEEAAYPYGDLEALDPSVTADALRAETLYHVTDALLLDYDPSSKKFEAQLAAAKQAVYEGHALSACYLNNTAYYQNNAYYRGEQSSQTGNYHGVTVVGWDDSFPASAFKSDPGRDGAWLVKNSWGMNWGDHGYFWLSYAEPSIVELYYLLGEPVEMHDDQYRYDDYGMWTGVSVEEQDTAARQASIFTAREDTALTAVMFCNAMTGDDYTIRVYRDPGADAPDSGELVSEQSGGDLLTGYHTVALDTPVLLHTGERFSIVVTLSGRSGQHIACECESRTEVTDANGRTEVSATMLTEERIRRDFHEGESFYSLPDGEWFDMYLEEPLEETYTDAAGQQVQSYAFFGNVCVRGLTRAADAVLFSEYTDSLPVGTAITLTSPAGLPILYSVNGAEEQLYTAPIVMAGDMEITARTGEARFTQHYTVQEARLSSLALYSGNSGQYAAFERTAPGQYAAYCSLEGDTLSLLAGCTGTLCCGDVPVASGVLTQVPWESPLVMTTAQEGMQTVTYTLYAGTGRGDVNLDGRINAVDASEILIYAARHGANALGNNAPGAAWLARADYNSSGTADANDASAVLVYAARHGAGWEK